MFRPFLYLIALNFVRIDGTSFGNDYALYDRLDNKLMKFHPMAVSWEEARLICSAEGAVLASPLDDIIQKTMENIVMVKGAPSVFTGISSTDAVGMLFSVEGINFESVNVKWAPGEPNNVDGEEKCIAMYANGTLADVRCNEPRPYICYKDNDSSLQTSDRCDQGYNYKERTGHCYKFHNLGQTWSRAFQTCVAEGGYLVIINSEAEAEVLNELGRDVPKSTIVAKDKNYALVGVHDWSEHRMWMTIHGQTLKEAGYDVWGPNQPGSTYREKCGGIPTFATGNLGFHDVLCDVPYPFICEKLPTINSQDVYILIPDSPPFYDVANEDIEFSTILPSA